MEELYNLNPQQLEAMKEVSKPVLILAGAGSGKTRVITHKIAYLVQEHKLRPWNILAVTFTNKAANEMKERALSMLNIDPDDTHRSRGLWISTFHSACGRILRRDIEKLGYTSNFTIYDTDDSKKIIKEIYKSMGLDPKKFSSTNNYISAWKNDMITPEEALKDAESNFSRLVVTYAKAYDLYEKKMKENNALDFDDLILKTIKLFKENPDVVEYYRNLFEYIMVDEFQDTNISQYILINMLSGKENISVVGDDDQSIYSWRGADISNILENFPKDYPDCKLVKLEQNYRSTNTILNAANSVIAYNSKRLSKNLWSDLGEGEKVIFHPSDTDREEADYVGMRISEKFKENPNENIAVFYRMNFQSRNFEEILRKRKIPYKIFGGIKFYERKEVKDLLAYLRIISNTSDSISAKRIINVPKRSIGKSTIQKVDELAEQYNLTFFEAIEYGCEEGIYTGTTKKKLEKFLDVIHKLQKSSKELTITKLFKYTVEVTAYEEYLKKECKDPGELKDRIANIEELERSLVAFEEENPDNASLEDYLMEINLQTDIDELEESGGYVSLMTIHKSKGLEFDTVFVSGCDEGILPHYMNMEDMDLSALEEERRLFYVAMTRARKHLYLSSAGERIRYRSTDEYEISSFIDEISENYIIVDNDDNAFIKSDWSWEKDYNRKKATMKKLYKQQDVSSKSLIEDSNDIIINETLYHPKFGKVKVKNIKHNGTVDSVIVVDGTGKTRNLILKYAKLSKTPY